MSEAVRCSECGAACGEGEHFAIDGNEICRCCLFGDAEAVRIYPIGQVVNDQKRRSRGFGLRGRNPTSRIELFPGQQRFMHRIGDESDLTIVYYLHASRPVRSRFRRGLDGKVAGVFATRTPDRLSRIGIQDVRLLEVQGANLVVEGLDAINGTPVLDIKMCWRRSDRR